MSAPLSPYKDELRQIISSNDTEYTHFRDHICQYNNANAFANFGAKMKTIIIGNGPYCFKISGEVYEVVSHTYRVYTYLSALHFYDIHRYIYYIDILNDFILDLFTFFQCSYIARFLCTLYGHVLLILLVPVGFVNSAASEQMNIETWTVNNLRLNKAKSAESYSLTQ